MAFKDLAAARRTVHTYANTEMDHEILLEALSTALLAPNHRNTHPWHFVVVGQETRIRLAERVFAIKRAHNPQIGEDERQAGLDSFARPAALVVFAQKRTESEFQRREDYATICCAIQNFTLALAEHGLGTKWSTAGFTSDTQVYRILGVPESDFEIVGFVWAGTPAGPLSTQQRPYLSDVLRVLP